MHFPKMKQAGMYELLQGKTGEDESPSDEELGQVDCHN